MNDTPGEAHPVSNMVTDKNLPLGEDIRPNLAVGLLMFSLLFFLLMRTAGLIPWGFLSLF